MSPRIARLALAAALALSPVAVAPALAQFAVGPPLTGRQVMQLLARRGFEPLSGARFNGDAYVVDALSPRGAPVRLVIDAYDGAVIRRVRLDAPRRGPYGDGPPPWQRPDEGPGDEIEEAPARPAPRPSRPAPSARVEPPLAPAPRPPAVPSAPVEAPAAPEPERPVAAAPEKLPTRTVPPASAARAPDRAAPPRNVRVIEGVTPVPARPGGAGGPD
ncbi:MAG TPA: hypothetical protein VEA41_12925 [Salinarimonas sp.]|nr:hypothetical protein [Salinarimonas sp.]